MNLLLHVCCAPCATYTVSRLREKGIAVTAFFYNPNIHPFQEFKKRRETFEQYAETVKLELLIERDYGLQDFLQKVVHKEENRCSICYAMRMDKAAEQARLVGADSFSSTLLYSKYQNHKQLISTAETAAARHGVDFYYEDFRAGWQKGIELAIEMKLYRQPYCGCIYSEQERYDNRLKKRLRKAKKLQQMP